MKNILLQYILKLLCGRYFYLIIGIGKFSLRYAYGSGVACRGIQTGYRTATTFFLTNVCQRFLL